MDVRYSILGIHLDNKLHSAIRLRYVAEQNRVSGSFSEKASPRFTLLDIDVSYAVSSLIAIKGGAQNLLNETYYEYLNRPIAATGTPLFAPGRSFFLMLSFKFP
jgi:iron complex outermembrane receptor protein